MNERDRLIDIYGMAEREVQRAVGAFTEDRSAFARRLNARDVARDALKTYCEGLEAAVRSDWQKAGTYLNGDPDYYLAQAMEKDREKAWIEKEAERLYNLWSHAEGWVPWQPRGNSHWQEEARQRARQAFRQAQSQAATDRPASPDEPPPAQATER